MRPPLAILFAWLPAAGCVCGTPTHLLVGADTPCRLTADCESPLVCVEGLCESAGDADADADADADVAADDTCDEFDFTVAPGPPPDLVLAVDRSGSMVYEIEEGLSKWDALLDAVDGVTHALEDRVDFGLASFPAAGDPDLCAPGTVIIEPAARNADAILARLRADGIGGGTPTAETLRVVGEYLRAGRAGHEDHEPVVLLATDGGPGCNRDLDRATCECMGVSDGGGCAAVENCLDDVRTYSRIDAVAGGDPAIPVYVVGLPGTESFAGVLSEMARRGGTARAGDPAYYDARSAADLEAALEEIAAGLVTCVFELDSAPDDPRQLRVTVDGEDVPHTDDGSEGWDYVDGEHTAIELHGSWCGRLEDGGFHEVTASYACEDLF